MVGEAPLPMPSAPAGGEWLTMGGRLPGNCAKRNTQWSVPTFCPGSRGGATAYSLPFMLGTYTVPSGARATDALSVGAVSAVHRRRPSGVIADSRPFPLTA